MPAPAILYDGLPSSSVPRNLIEPFALGGSIPMIELQSVVLPMPLRPITATASVPIENATCSSACAVP